MAARGHLNSINSRHYCDVVDVGQIHCSGNARYQTWHTHKGQKDQQSLEPDVWETAYY